MSDNIKVNRIDGSKFTPEPMGPIKDYVHEKPTSKFRNRVNVVMTMLTCPVLLASIAAVSVRSEDVIEPVFHAVWIGYVAQATVVYTAKNLYAIYKGDRGEI